SATSEESTASGGPGVGGAIFGRGHLRARRLRVLSLRPGHGDGTSDAFAAPHSPRTSHAAISRRRSQPGQLCHSLLGMQCPEGRRSEEHTSELQSRENLVCRLLLEKKNTNK